MSIFTDNYGNVRSWVYPIAAALIIGAVIAICGNLGPVVANWFDEASKRQPLPTTTTEHIVVESKDKQRTGMTCFEMIVLNCAENYDYFVNGEKVAAGAFNAVEVGKEYTCERNRYTEKLESCKEEEK